MKKYFFISLLLALAVALSAPLAFSQTANVRGVCKDIDGKPIAGAEVEWQSVDTGRKLTLKTNKNGEYFSLGLAPGKYNVTLTKDGKEIFHITGVTLTSGDQAAPTDIDLKKEQANAAAGQGKTPEQLKAEQEQHEKALKENNTVKALNEKITDANASITAGDFDKAIATLNDAIAMDSTRDLLWFKLGDAYRLSAPKQTDPDEKKKRYETAVADYQKAIDLRKGSEQAQKEADTNKKLAAYYNNLAESLPKENKTDDAIAAYNQAAQVAPDAAATYYFNEGAVLTNAGKADDAITAFNKVIAADPNKALAYYWKGINLIGKATVGKDNKMTAPDGTAEAFQKYIELDPNGPMAQTAKDMLATIGATVETGFGTKKKTVKK
ncbi:MAG: carboxypeptidase regulatory-like domain-containing protein [Terriglobales bacterium]